MIVIVPFAPILTIPVGSETHPVASLLNVKVVEPLLIAVTSPALVTDATLEFALVHIPPVEGDSCVFSPTHRSVDPVIFTIGFGSTIMSAVASVVHPTEFVTVTV